MVERSPEAKWSEATVSEMVTRHLNGMLSESEGRALNAHLAAHAASRAMFVRFSRLHGMLAEHEIAGRQSSDPAWDQQSDELDAAYATAETAGASLHDAIVQPAIRFDTPPMTMPTPAPVASPVAPAPQPDAGRWRLGRREWSIGLAAMLALSAGVAIWWHGGRQADSAVSTVAVAPATVGDAATLASLVNGELRRADGTPLAPGDLLPAEPVVAVSGWARLNFKSGAAVVVEAPATVQVLSASELSVTAGRVTAQVPTPAHGFTVSAPACRVVDLGTEFGVDVAGGGQTDVAVFKGSVQLKGHADAPERLTIGQGRRFATAAGPAVAAPINPDRFVQVAQFDRWTAASDATNATPAMRAASADEQLCRDPSLDLYYAFHSASGTSSATVPNLAPATRGQFALSLASPSAPTWAEGRLPGLAALDFAPARKQRLWLPQFPLTQTGQMTCCAWVYCRDRRAFASIAKNWGGPHLGGAFHFGLNVDGSALQVELDGGTPKPGGDEPDAIVLTDPSDQPFPVGRWVHVAFTNDGREACLFRDGAVVARDTSRPIAPKQPIQSLSIGYKSADTSDAPSEGAQVGFWDGRIGSLALFHRALSPDEIKRLADACKPPVTE